MNPPIVLGPIIHYLNNLDALNTSNQRVRDIMTGKAKDEIPSTGVFLWTDVRDLALAHVKAMELPEAGSKRFFVTAGYYNNREIADILRDTYPNRASKLPTPETKGGDYPEEGKQKPFFSFVFTIPYLLYNDTSDDIGLYKYDNSRTREILGIQFRSLKETIVDTAKSLEEVGA